MSKYRLEDDTLVDTDLATASYEEAADFNGSNWISRATGSQWEHQKLHRSRKGRYYLEHWSNWQGSKPSAELIDNEAAARWLLLNDHTLPEDLRSLAETVVE